MKTMHVSLNIYVAEEESNVWVCGSVTQVHSRLRMYEGVIVHLTSWYKKCRMPSRVECEERREMGLGASGRVLDVDVFQTIFEIVTITELKFRLVWALGTGAWNVGHYI